MPNLRKFVQFPHPGAEHHPDYLGHKQWNTVDRPHARKFLQLDGAWLDESKRETQRGPLWAWGEWEPESRVIKSLHAITEHHPHFLWDPYWVRHNEHVNRHNTDPFIYEGFYYTDCKQAQSPSLEGLRHLDVGSIIIFGSKKGRDWVLDTVLVVREFIDHDLETFSGLLSNRVPEAFWNVTLLPTYERTEKGRIRRLYIGATQENPISGMFSFFPCMPAGDESGFPRPSLELPSKYFTRDLAQGARGQKLTEPSLSIDTLKSLWISIKEQVVARGLAVGVAARSPRERYVPQQLNPVV